MLTGGKMIGLEADKAIFEAQNTIMDIQQIMEVIPHRYPFLFVDHVTEHTPGVSIAGYKMVTFNEQYFQGHFPNRPIMPGVLQIEALAQLGGVLIGSMPDGRGKIGLFAGVNNVRFRRMVVPGDRLDMKVQLVKLRNSICKIYGSAMVNEEPAVEAEMMFSLTDS
jgi:3-hydroxyacyl-[acyl-carrier-protein] dehydratase